MNYYVVAADGQKYGPADVLTLNQWAQEGRVLPNTMLEDLATGARIQASMVSGITFPTGPSMGGTMGPTYSQPSYQQPMYAGDNGASDMTMVWIFSALGFFCCSPLAIVAIVFAAKAQQKGHPQAQTGMIVAVLSLVLGCGLCFGLQGVLPAMGRFN